MPKVAKRKIEKLQIWVEYRFEDADRKVGARIKLPIHSVTDLLQLPATLAAHVPDVSDGSPQSLLVEVAFEGGHTAYLEIGKVGGAFGGLSIVLDETIV